MSRELLALAMQRKREEPTPEELEEDRIEEQAEECEEGEEAGDDDGDDGFLTDEEREALKPDDDDAAAASSDGDGDSSNNAGEGDDDASPAGEETGEADPEGQEDPLAAAAESDGQTATGAVQEQTPAAAGTESGDAIAAQVAAAQHVTATEQQTKADEQKASLEAIEEKRKALNEQFNDGEIDTVEYMDARDKLNGEQQEIDWRNREEKIHGDIAAQESAKSWDQANAEFFASNEQYGQSVSLQAALQAQYNVVHNDPAFAGASFAARLNEAKRLTDIDLGITAAPSAAPADKDAADKAKRAAMKGRGQEAGKVPTTISGAPAAAETDADAGGKYANLDKLDGVELENAIARMTEDEADAWRAHSH